MPKLQLVHLKRLRFELEFEKERAKVLRDSINEWKLAIAELVKQFASVPRENNDWKVRYDSQLECNSQLEVTARSLKKLAQERDRAKQLPLGADSAPVKVDPKIQVKELKELSQIKQNLKSKLHGYEWRLDEESKMYHKADEKRKILLPDINRRRTNSVAQHEKHINNKVERSMKSLQRQFTNKTGGHVPGQIVLTDYIDLEATDTDTPAKRVKMDPRGAARRSPFKAQPKHRLEGGKDLQDTSIIPIDKRIMDLKQGPMNKKATVRKLPPIQR